MERRGYNPCPHTGLFAQQTNNFNVKLYHFANPATANANIDAWGNAIALPVHLYRRAKNVFHYLTDCYDYFNAADSSLLDSHPFAEPPRKSTSTQALMSNELHSGCSSLT